MEGYEMSGGQEEEKRGLARLRREQVEQLEVRDVTRFRDGLFYPTFFTRNVWNQYVMEGRRIRPGDTVTRRAQTILG
jgi:hypothetical protein